ncbi:helix-turn-helix domain-containing protein [Anaeroselena agilis]|uniref:AraC family transcriptional regulator n=1 Tax=Anaeroselena agilis TaxID=3063788 RepID=A0ABU3P216_9FIRM|nr:AraC family transcriptional regulator [Selenomonadales bacterium 4137-cl]
MPERYKHLLGDGPYPPMDNFDIFCSEKVGVFVCKEPTEIPVWSHAHSSYEFDVAFSAPPLFQVEKKQKNIEIHKMIAINPDQEHKNVVPLSAATFCAIQVDRLYLQEMARQTYGKPGICFDYEQFFYDYELRAIMQSIITETNSKQLGYQFVIESLCVQLIVELFRKIKHNLPSSENRRTYYERDSINRVIAFLQENHNQEYSLDEVSRMANFSPYYFIRIFKAQTGKTPYEFLMEIKIREACRLLKAGGKSITEIAYLCGFGNSSHFSTVFKRKIGVSPLEYRKRS